MKLTQIELKYPGFYIWLFNEETTFEMVAQGEMFLSDGDLCMRTEDIDVSGGGFPALRAVNIETGEMLDIRNEEKVNRLFGKEDIEE